MIDFVFPVDVRGWLTEREGQKLYVLAKHKRVAEIGSFEGRSTICMGQSALAVMAIDTFDGRGTPNPGDTQKTFVKNIARYGLSGKVSHLVGTSEECAKNVMHHYFDLVFVDGSHEYHHVLADAEIARKLVKPDGFVAFHDYRHFINDGAIGWDPGVTMAVNELVSCGATIIDRVDTLVVLRLGREPNKSGKIVAGVCLPSAGDPAWESVIGQTSPSLKGVRTLPLKATSSLLTTGFNMLFCDALNCQNQTGMTHWAMIHSDIYPMPGWIDVGLEVMEETQADVVSAVVQFRDGSGLTSTGIATDDPWWTRRLTMKEVFRLPPTFTIADTDMPDSVLMVNTGLMLIDLRKPWIRETYIDSDGQKCMAFCFQQKDRIEVMDDGTFVAKCQPEDWLMSRHIHSRGGKIVATRKIQCGHRGEMWHFNNQPSGEYETDPSYEKYKETRCKDVRSSNVSDTLASSSV